MNDLLKRAAQEAARFDQDRLEPVHVLVALAEAQSPVGEALRACGVTSEAVAGALDGLSPRVTASADRPIWLGRATQELFARAQGLALAAGDTRIDEEHLLASLLWSGSSVDSILDRLAVTDEQIVAEVSRRDVSLPTRALPRRRSWGPWITMSPGELEEATAELRRTGTLYRYKPGQEGPAISIADDA